MSFRSADTDGVLSNERRSDHANDLAFRLEAGEAPTCEFLIAPGQGLVWDARAVLLADSAIRFGRWPGAGGAMRLMVNGDTARPARLVTGSLWGGPLGAFDLKRSGGRLVYVRHALAGVGPGIATAGYARLPAPAATGEDERFTMQRAEGNGWLFLTAAGRVIEHRLAPAEAVTANALCLVAMTATVDVDEAASAGGEPEGAERGRFVRFTGPGRVWLQTVEAGRVRAPLPVAKAQEAERAPKRKARPDLARRSA
jgi:hypothetical protein